MRDKRKKLTPTEAEQLTRSRRMQRLYHDLIDDSYDQRMDRDFAPATERFLRRDDIETLADVLVDTDDTLKIGLSQVGIDPEQLSSDDLGYVMQALRDIGVKFNRRLSCWCRD